MTTVVTVLPLPLEKDSRSIKIAASLARLGFDSVALESLPSSRPDLLPVPVTALGGAKPRAAAAASTQSGGGPLARLRGRMPRFVVERLHLLAMAVGYFVLRPIQGLLRAPRGDLYYLHEYRLFPMVRLLQILRPAAIIYDAHDFYPEVWRKGELSRFWRSTFLPFLSAWEGWVARRADAVVMVGDGVSRLFEQAYGVKPHVLRNCHDCRLERQPATNLREASGIRPDDLLLVSVGNRKPGMAVEQAIEALSRLPTHVHLAFVGRFHDDAAVIAQRFGVAARVHALGAVAPEEVVPYIRSADAALILYWPETGNYENILPNGFFQSISAHLPLLWPTLPDLVGIVGERDVGRKIDPTDPASVAAAVQWLIDNPEATGYARECVRKLAQEVCWEREEEKLGVLVARVLEKVSV
ncbi:hypothetical protein CU669_11185 [Paramagnetospirillum kuznetsovii]|uniref:Glycosyltransferase subfamily 4-like N-terminal domain-containing protein n=1 Tax=Paramagnetospirillum kuznetsovii TaxID=2053833 RepID=A0A364NXQ2_9PROT|nr:glycosyltransferase family 4 protein [Paramagnetospirillum kuznetsovii]RAU21861.1 hypothetical protein CU669_11185 [Paramagnetospirillum kuznetsovii]